MSEVRSSDTGFRWPNIEDLVGQLKSGRRDPVKLVEICLAKIHKAKHSNAVLEVNPQAIKRAHELKQSKPRGRLFGVPFVAKDNFLTLNTHTTAASNILKPYLAPYQATAIERLEAEGAIMLGKTNLDAFAHGSSTENSDFGPTQHPLDPARVPGGSSGGSAAAVALGLAAFGLGTDTGGSIRQPAAFCGVVGLKPTYGLISRYGVIAMASSTDVIGPLTRSVADSAYLLDIMAGEDGFDSTMIAPDTRGYSNIQTDLKKLKIGVIKEHLESTGVEAGVKRQIKNTIATLVASGASVRQVSIPIDEQALATYYILVPAEVSSNLARYDGIKYGYHTERPKTLEQLYTYSRGEGFGAEAKRRVLTGTYVLSSGYYDAYYKRAQAVRTLLIEQYQKTFSTVDILVGPTAPTVAFKIGAKAEPLSMYLNDVLTVAANLTGDCAISLPVGLAKGLPVGLQLVAPQRHERRLLGAALAIEKLVGQNG